MGWGAYSDHGLGLTLVMGWGLLWSWVGTYSGHGLGPTLMMMVMMVVKMMVLIMVSECHTARDTTDPPMGRSSAGRGGEGERAGGEGARAQNGAPHRGESTIFARRRGENAENCLCRPPTGEDDCFARKTHATSVLYHKTHGSSTRTSVSCRASSRS